MDVVCYDDLDPQIAELDDPIAELEQDLYHRLIEEPGTNIDDPDRGLGLEQMLSGAFDPRISRRIENELRKDIRVHGCTCAVTQLDRDNYRIDIEIEPDPALVPERNAALIIFVDQAARTIRRAA